tara:strand:- start:279 stop:545 length:267 start_codon:yes stop_codon:yes gene_type:complete
MELLTAIYVYSIPIFYVLWVLFFSFTFVYSKEIEKTDTDENEWGVMLVMGIPMSILWPPIVSLFLIFYLYRITVLKGMSWLVKKLWSE